MFFTIVAKEGAEVAGKEKARTSTAKESGAVGEVLREHKTKASAERGGREDAEQVVGGGGAGQVTGGDSSSEAEINGEAENNGGSEGADAETNAPAGLIGKEKAGFAAGSGNGLFERKNTCIDISPV